MKMMKPAKPMKQHRLTMNPAHGLVRHSVSQTTNPIIPMDSMKTGFFIWLRYLQAIDLYL